MSHPRACRFFNTPGGCRHGSNCHFIHGDSPHIQPNTTADMPSGYCRYFWSTGQCRLGFNCRYPHKARPVKGDADSDVSWRGQVVNLHATINAQESTTPIQVHNRLRRFLDSSFRFEHSRSPNRDICAFIALLGNATKENNWVSYCLPARERRNVDRLFE